MMVGVFRGLAFAFFSLGKEQDFAGQSGKTVWADCPTCKRRTRWEKRQ